MKKIWNIFWIILFISTNIYSSTRGDVKIIEASENIRLMGQKIAKDYLYYYKNPKKIKLREDLYKDIEILENSIVEIGMITKHKDSKNILDFLSYNKDEIKSLLKESVSKEKSILMLDYGESFLEGANSIAKEHAYDFSKEEKMLIAMKSMEYLLERATKYYVATALNIDKNNNLNSMKQSINGLERIVSQINAYTYPDNLTSEVEKMNSAWQRHREYLYKSSELSVPNLILSSESVLKKSVAKIALYHKQNQ